MTLLSGGVSEMAMPTTGQVANLQAYYQAYPTAMNQAFDVGISYNQPSYYAPQTAYSVPIYGNTSTSQVNNYSTPTNVNYAPTNYSNSSLNVEAPNLSSLAPNGLMQENGGIQIGRNTYAPQNLLASNPQTTFAPGSFNTRTPSMDTVSDAAQGYRSTAVPPEPSPVPDGQPYNLGGSTTVMPDNLPAPNIGAMGMQNPYQQMPMAPQYMNSAAGQYITNAPQQVMSNMPQRGQYPSPPPMSNNPWVRAIQALPGPSRTRALQAAAAESNYRFDADKYAQMMQTIMPSAIGGVREMKQQEGADYRMQLQGYQQGSLSVLNSMLDEKANQLDHTAKALDVVARAQLMPSFIDGQPNRQKADMINHMAPMLGYSERDILGLMNQQNPEAAAKMQMLGFQVKAAAFELDSAKQRFGSELNYLKAQISQAKAQAGYLAAQGRTVDFNVNQRQAIAKFERWGMIADQMDKVSNMIVGRSTRDERVNAIELANKNALANMFKTQAETANIPKETAARMASALAGMGASIDPRIRAMGAAMGDSLYAELGIQQIPYITGGTANKPTFGMRPVNAPSQIQQPQMQTQPQYQAPPGYRQRQLAQPAQTPTAYLTGQPLSDAGNRPMPGLDSGQSLGPFPLMNTIDGGPTGYGGQPAADAAMFQPSAKELQAEISKAVRSGKQINPNTDLGKYDRAMHFVLSAVMRGTRTDLSIGRASGSHQDQYNPSREVQGTIMDNVMQADAQVQAETGKSLTELYNQYGLATMHGGMDGYSQELARNAPRLVVPDLVRFKPSSQGSFSLNASEMELSPHDMTSAGAMYMQEMNATGKNIARINQWAASRSGNKYKGYREMAQAIGNDKAVRIYDKWAMQPPDEQVSGRVIEPDIIFESRRK